MQSKYLAVIPFYFGDLPSTVDTCRLLVDCFFRVIIFDNSLCLSKAELPAFDNIQVITPTKNEGVYGAYHYAFSVICDTSFTHLLFLDQDSTISKSYIEACTNLMSSKLLGSCALAPLDIKNLKKTRHTSFINTSIHSQLIDAKGSGLILPREYCIQSLLNPRLYMDYQDWILCWKLTSMGFKIYQLNFPLPHHSLGSLVALPFMSIIAFRIPSPSRIVNQLWSSIYLLLAPEYYRIIPIPRRFKLTFRILLIPFLFLFSLFIHRFTYLTNNHG